MATVKKHKATTLPQDIITEILSRLPVKTLTRFKCVSKHWSSLTQTPKFITSHLRNSALNPSLLLRKIPRDCDSDNFDLLLLRDEATTALESVHVPFMVDSDLFSSIEVSCNGIFCIKFYAGCCILNWALWNPATRQLREIPTPKIKYCPPGKYQGRPVFGLGFDSEIEDYTLVRIEYFEDYFGEYDVKVPDLKVEVYKGSTGDWREIEDCVLPCGDYRDSVSAKGVVYWMVSGLGDFAGREFIVGFDLDGENEVFRRIAMPGGKDYKDEIYLKLVVFMQESVAVFVECEEGCFELWAMNECSTGGGGGGGGGESWSKLFRIGWNDRIARPLGIWKDSKVIMEELEDGKSNESGLFLCELSRQEITDLMPIKEVHDLYEAYTYVESLVSLGGGIEVV